MFKIAIILGSTRSQANGRALFNHLKLIIDQLPTHSPIHYQFLDLANYQLPFLMNPSHRWRTRTASYLLTSSNGSPIWLVRTVTLS